MSRAQSSYSQSFKKNMLASAVALACANTAASLNAAELEEVVVTATKRALSSRDVPYNISAVTSDTVNQLGISNVSDLSRIAPGITVNDSGARTGFINNSIIIRGLNVDNNGLVHSPTKSVAPVSIYVNDTPLYTNLQLMDVERIEVLRGPQGTLYGSGSMGGNIRYVLSKPSTDEFFGEVSAEISSTNHAADLNNKTTAIINIPVSEKIALRFNASYAEDAGYVDYTSVYQRADNNPFNPGAALVLANPADPINSPAATFSSDNANNSDATFLRAAARYEGEKLVGTFNYYYQELNADAMPIYHSNNQDDEYRNQRRVLDAFEGETEMASFELEYDLGFASLTSVTSQSDVKNQGVYELTERYLLFSFYPAYYGNSPRPIIVDHSVRSEETFTQEIRLTSTGDGPFSWIVGAYYQKVDGETVTRQYYPGYDNYANACIPVNGLGSPECGFGTLFGVPGFAQMGGVDVVKDLAYLSDFQDEFEDLALYGEVTFEITDAWQATLGMRFFDQEYVLKEQGGLMFVPDGVVSNTNSVDESDELFKFNTSYHFVEDHQVYVTWSEGMRRGGANALGPMGTPETNVFTSDTIENIEIGFKGLINNSIEYTIGYFDIQWDNVQIRSNCSSLALICQLNGGSASSEGLELEVTAQITDSIRVNGGYTYVDAALDDPQGGLAGVAVAGTPLPGVSNHTANVTGLYQTAINDQLSLDASLSVSYGDERVTSVSALLSEDIDSFTVVDLAASLHAQAWSARLFIDNVLNEDARLSQQSTRTVHSGEGPLAPAIVRKPRTAGVSISYRF